MLESTTSRRAVLTWAGTTGLGALVAGTATATDRVEYNIGTAGSRAERAVRTAATAVHRELDWGGGQKTITATLPTAAVEGLSARADVRYVERNGEMHAIAQTLPWGVDRVDAEVAHANGETGGDDGGDGGDSGDDPPGGDIAIIDTGIDSDHPDLVDNLGTGHAVVSSRGPYAEPWDDDNGHGTHCAGIADAVDNGRGVVGVSTNATLHAVKVLDNSGSGSFSDVAAGIQWVADQGYDVGSMSLGASSGSQTVKDACQYAVDNGVLLVGAAGNSGPCSDCVGYPAAYQTVIAVSATDKDDSLASYSSTGPEVEIAAPGTNIYSTYAGGGYETLSGTSMATPHVAGAAGQLMDNGDSNTQARDQLGASAEDIGLAANEQGNGLLDVAAALGFDSSDDLGDGGGGNTAPTVDSIGATEVETSDGDAEFDVSWSVSDADGNLASVDLTLTDDTAGTTDDTATESVSGDTASGTTRLVASGDDGSGNSYTVSVTVSDDSGATASDSTTITETEDTTTAPTVDSLSLAEDNSGGSPHADFDAAWTVSDGDGDLATVDLVLTDTADGATVDSASISVGGSTASGTTGLTAKHAENDGHTYEVTCTVTDGAGTTGSATTSEVEDGA
ncbi:MAG: S8 family serine peptidase [Halobacteriaceae archaeon]